MVTAGELDRFMIDEMFGDNLLKLYREVVNNGNMVFSFSRKTAETMLILKLYDAGFTVHQIAQAVGVTKKRVWQTIRRHSRKIYGAFMRTVEYMGDPIRVLSASRDNAYIVSVTRVNVEILIIIKLMKGGWSNRQIQRATGFNIRRIQRTRKRLKDGYE